MTTVHNVSDRRHGWIGSWETEPLVLAELTADDLGRTVIYTDHGRAEAGTLTGWSGQTVWARYDTGSTAAGAAAASLCFGIRALDGDLDR